MIILKNCYIFNFTQSPSAKGNYPVVADAKIVIFLLFHLRVPDLFQNYREGVWMFYSRSFVSIF